MVELKTAGEIEAMRAAGQIVAKALAAVRSYAAVGMSLRALDAVAAEVIDEAGGKPSFLYYQPGFAESPFPAVLCVSVNDAVVHGIPGRYRLADGDLVSIDCGAHVDGWHGDAAITFAVGQARPEDEALIEGTQRALQAGIAAARTGGKLGDIAHAMGLVGRATGFGIPRGLGGHGVGRTVHEDPHVANEGKAGRGLRLRPGLVLALEPMLSAGGGDEVYLDRDGWTVRTADGSRAAHSEHTVAITADGPLVLTA